MRRLRFLLFLALAGNQLNAQVITGSVTGSVVDPSGGAIAAATVTLTSDSTKEVHSFTANTIGTFSFAAVQPGVYTLKVEHAGFKSAEQSGIHVAATDHVALGEISLQVGSVTETIVVEAQAAQIASDSSQVSAGISNSRPIFLI